MTTEDFFSSPFNFLPKISEKMNNSLEFDESRDPFPDWGTSNFRNSRERIENRENVCPVFDFCQQSYIEGARSLGRLGISSTCHFINLPFRQLAISSTCHCVNLPFLQLAIVSTCHFVNLPFRQLAISSTCHFVNLPFHQLAISSTCHFVNLPFHQPLQLA